MARTYTLKSTGMYEGYYPGYTSNWNGAFMGTSRSFRVGYISGYRYLNCLFDQSELNNLRSKTIISIKLAITVVSGTIYVNNNQFPIRYKYNDDTNPTTSSNAWASSNADSTEMAAVNIGYITAKSRIVCDNTKYEVDLGTIIPKYGYVLGTVESNHSAWYTIKNSATLTVVTDEDSPGPGPDPGPTPGSIAYSARLYPLLFNSNEINFNNNGLGTLYDAISCEVSEEINGKYELTMQYPINGIHFNEIELRSIILAKPNMVDRRQPFRVYRMTKPMNGIVKIYAEHISYDLNGIPIAPFSALNLSAAINYFNNGSLVENPFLLYTTKSEVTPMSITKPISYRSALGGTNSSLLETYGGELKFDWFDVYLLANRGTYSGVSLRYGKNLSNVEQDSNMSATYSGVLAYWTENDNSGDETIARSVVQSDVIYASNQHTYDKILSLDATSDFKDKPTKAQLNEYVNKYINEKHPEIPEFSISVAYQDNPELMEAIGLGDQVSVIFTKLGVNGMAECKKTVYDVLKRRYKSVTLGEVQNNVASTFSSISTKLTETRQRLIDETRRIVKEFQEEADLLRISISDITGSTTQITQKVNQIEAAVASLDRMLQVVMDDNSVTYNFVTQVQEALNASNAATDERFTNINKYIRMEDGTIVVGILGNAVQLTIRNDTVLFGSPDGSVTYAYFANDQFEVPSIVASYIQFGHSDTYRDFYWKVRENGHITLLR